MFIEEDERAIVYMLELRKRKVDIKPMKAVRIDGPIKTWHIWVAVLLLLLFATRNSRSR